MRRTLHAAVALAAVLLVVAPLLHLHYRALDEDSSHCAACTAFHAVDVNVDSLAAPEGSIALVVDAVNVSHRIFILTASSRAPPQPLS